MIKEGHSMDGKEVKKTWEKSMKVDGFTKRIKVREIENGFIIELNKYGDIMDKNGESKWIDISKEFFSEVNPLADKQMDVLEEAKNTAKSLGIDLRFE